MNSAIALALLLAAPAAADSVSITPTKDNTLIQRADPNAQFSNGLGDIFIGRTNQDGQGPATISIRRGLVQFDIAGSIPAGSTITGVTLSMRDVMGLNGDPTVSLHRVLQNWGEGTSFQAGGQGAPATQNDATWLYTFYNSVVPASSPTWTTPGGDFSPTTSASSVIIDDLGGGQIFSWSGAGLIADVQYFLDNPATNFGWILLGDESAGQTAKRFNSSESTVSPNVPPALLISYQVPEPATATLVILGGILFGGARLGRKRRR